MINLGSALAFALLSFFAGCVVGVLVAASVPAFAEAWFGSLRAMLRTATR